MKLYIGNLPYEATEAEVRALFADFEPLNDFYYAIDRYTGKPRGFAFATLPTREDAERAIEALNGQDFSGRPLRVREAVDKPKPPRGGGGGGGYRDDRGGGDRRGGGGGGDRRGGGGGHRGDRRGGGRRDDW